MAATALGKRGRSSNDEPDLPLRRATRQKRSFVVINDENQDPKSVSFADALAADVATYKSSPKKRNHDDLTPALAISPAKGLVPLTPTTPRFRHCRPGSQSSAVTTPPVTPSTPRHRVMSVGKISRRTPFGADGTPRTPSTPGSQTIYHKARQLFARSSEAGTLVGRDDERARLSDFLKKRCGPEVETAETDCSCLYVSGPPGTGKSAMVTEMTDKACEEFPGVRKAYVNCMSIRSSNDLYSTLLRMLADDDTTATDISETDAMGTLQALFLPKKGKGKTDSKSPKETYLLVLDEIDHILTLDLESLYRVMEWSMIKTSRLVLVGIANALDLTDRFLPRLKSRNLVPELLPFLPYTAAQIKNIIMTRLRSALPADTSAAAGFVPFFHPAAIELCSRKVASQTGDLRKAFEILRRALDLVEADAKEKHMTEALEVAGLTLSPSKKQPLGENANLASAPAKATLSPVASWLAWARTLTAETAPRASIGHLNKVTAAAFGNGAQQRLRGLNLQQKAALCALMALEKWNRATHAQTQAQALAQMSPAKVARGVRTPTKSPVKSLRAGASAAPTIKMLFDTYCKMCKSDAVLHPLSSSEFREVVGSLETLSLVTAVDGRTGSFAALQMTPGRRGRGPRGGNAMAVTGVAGDEKQVASCIGEKELEAALEGVGAHILQSILSGEALE